MGGNRRIPARRRRRGGRYASRAARRTTGSAGEPDDFTVRHLDELDRAIVEQLQENGRRPNAVIARTLDVTETTIRNRIERLVSGGFLRIAAVIDPRKTAYQVDVIIWMRLQRQKAKPAAQRIASFPNVVYVGHTTGRYDLLIEAVFESDEALFEFLTTELSESWGVLQTETYHIIRTEKINYDWKVPLNHQSAYRPGSHRRRRGAPPARLNSFGVSDGSRRPPARGRAWKGGVVAHDGTKGAVGSPSRENS